MSSLVHSARALLPPLRLHLSASFNPCADPQPHLSGALAEPPSLKGYEPKQLAETQDHRHSEDNQLAEHEDPRVKPLFFRRPDVTSTYDSAESIVTPPPDSDLDYEQIRALVASPLYLQEQMRNDHKFITVHEKT